MIFISAKESFWINTLRLLLASFSLSSSFVLRTQTALTNSLSTVSKLSDKLAATRTSQTTSKSLFPSIVEKSRTIANVCVSGTLCTLSSQKLVEGYPFGSYVDYILDENGWPILLLNEKSQHSQNILRNKAVSLFCQPPSPQYYGQTGAALGRVTVTGNVESVDPKSATPYKYAFSLVHPYTEEMVENPKFFFAKIKPSTIYYTSGFGAEAEFIDVKDYERTQPDVLAQEIPSLLPRINVEKQKELKLMCKHFLRLQNVDTVRLHNIDRLGVDIRVKIGPYVDEYRIAFRHPVVNVEDAKSELVKLFQECWERESTGKYYTDTLPDIFQHSPAEGGHAKLNMGL